MKKKLLSLLLASVMVVGMVCSCGSDKSSETSQTVKDTKETEEKKEFTVHKRVCGNCVDVCPNRSNVLIEVASMELLQVLHVDQMCNECGNCRSFCQYAGAPYKDKFTLFATEEDMKDSTNNGFVVLDAEKKEVRVRVADKEETVKADQPSGILTEGLSKLICAVINKYAYLLG